MRVRVNGRPLIVTGIPIPDTAAAYYEAAATDDVEDVLNTLGIIVLGVKRSLRPCSPLRSVHGRQTSPHRSARCDSPRVVSRRRTRHPAPIRRPMPTSHR